jgi:transposase-like protein
MGTVRKGTTKRSEQEKLKLIEQWEVSGQAIKTFCDGHGFSDSLFHSWLNKYRRGKRAVQPEEPFVALVLEEPTTNQSPGVYAEIVLANGSHIKLYQRVDAAYIRQLLVLC